MLPERVAGELSPENLPAHLVLFQVEAKAPTLVQLRASHAEGEVDKR
jgi:hypothetical protein